MARYIPVIVKRKETKPAVAILGYGSQGKALALNLRDSRYKVVIGLRPRSKSRAVAKHDGFEDIRTVRQAVQKSSIVCFAFPDHVHDKVYEKDIRDCLQPESCLLFLHGLSVRVEREG